MDRGSHASQPAWSYVAASASQPVLEQTLGGALRLAGKTWPSKPALIQGALETSERRKWTFEDLIEQSEQVAGALLSRFEPGDHVAIWMAMLCVPTMLIRMLEHPSIGDRDFSSWRLVTLGGAPVPPELVRRTQSMGIKVAIGFGQTEASPYITHTLPDDSHPEWVMTVGRPMAQTEIKIIDPETGETVPVGAIGEICARGYSVMKDYFENPDATREVLDADGWLHTGDLGSLDEHGYCRVQGRQKDMIIRGGENIYPREIEDVLHDHALVSAVSVVGVPDKDWGEVLVAFVQVKAGEAIDEHELMEFCRSRLASFKVPRIWKFVEQFPQTTSGKIQKFVLRDAYMKE